ncbi:MAG TPA: metallophosphoesterase [Blastocatellia bacterium]|nr:metallophosphoesterase [Blastocatellia bacterium]
MREKKTDLITRRQAIISLATVTAGALVKPTSIFSSGLVKDKITFAVIGDWGTGDEDQYGLSKRMFDTYNQKAFDFVLTTGDNIYTNGSGRYFPKKFEQPFAGLIKEQVPFFATLGNHDVQEGRKDQTSYPLFNMNGNNYYTISKGNGLVDFFMLDTTDFGLTQTSWLENALRNSKAKWKIAAYHHPLYSSGKKHGSNDKLRKQIEPLLVRYGVKVTFAGHDHIYQRVTLQQGIQHFVTGAGGEIRRGGVDMSCEYRAASYDADNHFMLLELEEKEISFKAISETGEVVDSGTIKQES